jgi:4-amino-4-deoxy-L-arabinose transferase-like glycosyltransferase
MSTPALTSLEPTALFSSANREPRAPAEPVRERVGRRQRWLTAIGLAVTFGIFVARCLSVARAHSITSDESTYLTHGLHFWLTGNDLRMWELGTPRLPHLVNTWPSYVALEQQGLLPAKDAANRLPLITQLVLSGVARVLLPARMAAIGWGLALLGVVFWGVARTRGAFLGLVATALLAMVPEVLAHATIAGSDVPFAAAAVLALLLLARYAERPSPGRWMAVAVAVGLAWAMRHSALILLILAPAVHAWCALWRPHERGAGPVMERLAGSACASVAFLLVAYSVLWAGDGFGTVSVAEASESITSLSLPSRIGPIDVSHLPIPTSALSVLKQISHQNRGHEAYFCGQYGQQGWPLYFPVAFLLKTPTALLILMVIAAARVRSTNAWEAICLVCLVLLWAVLVRSKVNIGVRYALLTYPLALPFVARLFERRTLRDPIWGPVTLAAVAVFAGASAASHPSYLSYFNSLGGGPRMGWLYLADSNIDWGQDFDALAAALKRLGINDVTIDVSSERRLQEPGLVALVNPSREFQAADERPGNRRLYDSEGSYLPVYTRYVAVSVSRLLGLYSRNDMSWLRTRRLVARVRDSVFLFDMDTPAEAPFEP